MKGEVQRGFLLLADISGFTEFLAQAELDHAQDLLSELLELIANHLSTGLTLAEVEGDAIYLYAPDDRMLRGETLLEIAETAYVAFRDRVEAIRRNTSCDCKACRNIPALDLKFLVHFGEYVLHSVAGSHKPLGSDVNLLHRLAKNHVVEATGWRAYLLMTEACLRRLGLPEAGLHQATEAYASLGEVRTYSSDLHARYQEIMNLRRVIVSPEDGDLVITYDLPASLPVAWEWLNDPQKRSLWEEARVFAEGWTGRSGPGLRTHCVHGDKETTVQTILDWRPFEYYTMEIAGPGGRLKMATNTVRLEPIEGGTRITDVTRAEIKPRWISRIVMRRAFEKGIRQSVERLKRMVSAAVSTGPKAEE